MLQKKVLERKRQLAAKPSDCSGGLAELEMEWVSLVKEPPKPQTSVAPLASFSTPFQVTASSEPVLLTCSRWKAEKKDENDTMPYDERRFPDSLQLGEQMLSSDCVLLPSRFEGRGGAAVMPAKDFAAGDLLLQWEPMWKPAKGKPAKNTNVLFQKFVDNSGKIVQNLFAEVNGSSANALAQHLHFLPEAVSGVHLLSVEILCRPYRPPIVYFSAAHDIRAFTGELGVIVKCIKDPQQLE